MRSVSKHRNIPTSLSLILMVLLSGVLAVAQKGLGGSGVTKDPGKPANSPRSDPGIRQRRATVRRHNASPKSSETPETANPEKPAGTAPVPGLEDKRAGIESYNKEDYDKAIERLNAAGTLRPADAEIFYYLGDSYSVKKQYKEAIDAYIHAIKIDEKLATEGNYFNLGYAYEVTQDNSNAFQYYQKALGKKNDNPETLTHLGDVSSKLRNWKNAIDAYEQAFALHPNIEDPEVFFNWGLAYVNSSRQYDKAAQKFEKAVELKIDNIAEAYFQLGRAYKFSGKFREAVEAYKKQLEKKADDDNAYWAYFELGDIYSFELPDREAALQAYERAVRINGNDDWTWAQLGTLQSNLNKNPDAANSFSQAVQLKPNNAEYRLGLGKTYWKLQRYSEAIETLNKALELNAKLSEAYYYRGLTYKSLGQVDQAVESLNRSLENPFVKRRDEGGARYNLAEYYLKLGKVDAARQQCDLLRSMGPDAPQNTAVLCK